MNVTLQKINPVNCKKPQIKPKTNNTQQIAFGRSFGSFDLFGISARRKAKIELEQQKEKIFFDEFLHKKGRVTKEEYQDIVKHHPSALVKAQKYCFENYKGASSPRNIADITLRLDEYFKKKYRNYRIISIGTSPSPVTEQLANMGHDVVFLPVTGLRLGYIPCLTELDNRAELRALMQYLDTKNIDDGKLNIILDYTSSGITLNAITGYIQEYFNFAPEQIKKLSLNDDILRKYFCESKDNLVKDLVRSDIEEASNVPHFPVTQKGIRIYRLPGSDENMIFFDINEPKQELFEKFDNNSTPLGRAFALCTMHEINNPSS